MATAFRSLYGVPWLYRLGYRIALAGASVLVVIGLTYALLAEPHAGPILVVDDPRHMEVSRPVAPSELGRDLYREWWGMLGLGLCGILITAGIMAARRRPRIGWGLIGVGLASLVAIAPTHPFGLLMPFVFGGLPSVIGVLMMGIARHRRQAA